MKRCFSFRNTAGKAPLQPMLTEKRRASLSSMYSLVGSHSAVKLCRWQKSMLRGRGGCYKWTMYGIASHRCIEATPNLACANNCVFCWRLNSNPTTKAWHWLEDKPQDIVDKLISAHRDLIQNVSGMPGVFESLLDEAKEPRHCALSLVGEPILYPQVNEFVRLLHEKNISTFLVTNGQFPSCISRLDGVTQLYLSVDAPTSEIMKIVDRPILPDYWDRFQQSVNLMRKRRERTVFRLTLMEGINMNDEHVQEYAHIFAQGDPDFIELKRLTPAFQGHHQSFLRMKNVPSWERVKAFSTKICEVTAPCYLFCCVHEHSGCVLLSKSKFFVNSQLNSWIDFEKFHHLVSLQGGKEKDFPLPEEYWLPTPEWALSETGNEGFDPKQRRHYTAKRRKYLEKTT